MSSMSEHSKEKFKELLEELVDDTCHSEYCFLRRFLESLHPSPMILIQLKCMEKFKNEVGDVDWDEAGILWEENGWAKAFREVFDEELKVREIYELTKQKVLENCP